MAKAKKIKGSTEIAINKSSKNATYVIDKNAVDSATINFTSSVLKLHGNGIPVKGTDDVFLNLVAFNETTKKIKYIYITIKDYYKYYETNPNLVQISGESIHDRAKEYKDAGAYYTHEKKIEGILSSVVVGDKKNTTYNINQAIQTDPEKDIGIQDMAGNDKYTFTAPFSSGSYNIFNIYDLKGKDKYNILNGSSVKITDEKGADIYTIKDSQAVITEYSGNDKYTITDSHAKIEAYKGNDKYTCKNSFIQIGEMMGNDSYNIDGNITETEAKQGIEDMSGKDKYVIKNTQGLVVADIEGKDKYTVSNATMFASMDNDGNDTYKLNNVSTANKAGIFDYEKYFVADSSGNDKYTITGSDTYLVIRDAQGKDTYNIKGSYNKKTRTATYVGTTEIYDVGVNKNTFNVNYAEYARLNTESGTNTFNIKNSAFVFIGANKEGATEGKDTYTLDSNMDFTIYDYGLASDTYSLKNSNSGLVCDYGGDDKYTITNMVFNPKITEDEILAGIVIEDRGGTKDTLTLKTTKKDNIIYMSDFEKYNEYNRSSGNSLIIYDKSTQGYVFIDNFYSADENYDFTGFGDGKIETIKAKSGKKLKTLDVSTNTDTYTHFNEIKATVINWLETQSNQGVDFNCVEDVLIYGTDAQKATLVGYFDPNANIL